MFPPGQPPAAVSPILHSRPIIRPRDFPVALSFCLSASVRVATLHIDRLAPAILSRVHLPISIMLTTFCSYRIHLSPGSRRNSGTATRAAMNRASASDRPRSSRRRSRNESADPGSPAPPTPVPSPPLEPPALAPAYQSLAAATAPPQSSPSDALEPPDTPPPLAQAYPTLPPPTAPVYSQLPIHGRDVTRSTRSTPEASYHSPVSYTQSSLATASYPQYDDHSYSSSQESRTSSSFGRTTGDDPRWAYTQHQQQSYPTSESDRYSPASPVANAQYTEPASPVDAYSVSSHRAPAPGSYQMSQESASYYSHYQPRQASSTALSGNATNSSPLAQPHSQQQSTNRHSIAHISNPVNRQHSPTSTSTTSAHSASPVVSHPSTPAGYGYVPSSMGSYADSPPGSVSPVAPTTSQLPSGMVSATTGPGTYGSYEYESNSLTSAGYALPPPQQQTQQQTQAYDRTLPALSPVHARESQSQSSLPTHFNYGQQGSYHSGPASSGARRTSPPPVLAPIHVRRDAGAVATQTMAGSMRYASPPQPPMQSLASVSRISAGQHAFSYPPPAPTHSPTYAHTSSSYGSAASASAVHGSGYYYHQQPTHAHGQRAPSPEPVDAAAEQYLELHQPQPQRVVAAAHAGGGQNGHLHHHQYMQTGAVPGHAGWRTDDYHRGRGGLVQ